MTRGTRVPRLVGMQILNTLEERDPPAGVVRAGPAEGHGGDGTDLPFTGWLGLLAVLSEIVEPPELRRGGG